jgi:hypothetical protein
MEYDSSVESSPQRKTPLLLDKILFQPFDLIRWLLFKRQFGLSNGNRSTLLKRVQAAMSDLPEWALRFYIEPAGKGMVFD